MELFPCFKMDAAPRDISSKASKFATLTLNYAWTGQKKRYSNQIPHNVYGAVWSAADEPMLLNIFPIVCTVVMVKVYVVPVVSPEIDALIAPVAGTYVNV